MSTATQQRSVLGRDSEPQIRVVEAVGSHLYDDEGREYIDFVMGWCVANLGWSHPELARRMLAFRGPDYVFPGHDLPAWSELAELLVSIAPGRLARCFRATGGSEAVDLALQAALIHTERRRFLSLEDSYHGNTIAGLSIGSVEDREAIPNVLTGCHQIHLPLDEDALDRVETQLKHRDVAAFVFEPISINLGVQAPAKEFVRGIGPLCRRYGTLIVADEVASGFGRTGAMFACEKIGLEPDILCLAKAITNGLAPMGAMLATRAVAESIEDNGSFYSTYGWHPRVSVR